jgi:hypothetical protein
MKLSHLVILTLVAFSIMVAFRSAMQQPGKAAFVQKLAETKKFSIRCSPAYQPATGDDIPLLSGVVAGSSAKLNNIC